MPESIKGCNYILRRGDYLLAPLACPWKNGRHEERPPDQASPAPALGLSYWLGACAKAWFGLGNRFPAMRTILIDIIGILALAVAWFALLLFL